MISPNTRRTVLLVEDSDDDAFFFEHAFASAQIDCEFFRVSDGREALAFIERLAADGGALAGLLIFLDLKLPVLNGFEVLREIRARELDLEVVVLSGSDLESDVAAAKALGASDYMVKPISSADIKRKLTANLPVNRSS